MIKRIGLKFLTFVILGGISMALLSGFAGCGETPVSYATFKVGDETIKVIEIIDGRLAEAEPEVPSVDYYEGAWENYSTQNGDVTVNAVYTPIPYTVSFMADDELCDTRTYTIDDRTVEPPAVPMKSGFTGEWSAFDISEEALPSPENITVTALYTSANATAGLNYSVIGGTEYGVNGRKAEGEDIVIPAVYRNLPVTQVNPGNQQIFAFTGKIGTLVFPASVSRLCQNSFYNLTVERLVIFNPKIDINTYLMPSLSTLTVDKIFYYGSSSEWLFLSNTNKFGNATVYYFSEEKPTSAGNYWYPADDGITPVIWTI